MNAKPFPITKESVPVNKRLLFKVREASSLDNNKLWAVSTHYDGTDILEGCVTEWSPSGRYIRLDNDWYDVYSITILEQLS